LAVVMTMGVRLREGHPNRCQVGGQFGHTQGYVQCSRHTLCAPAVAYEPIAGSGALWVQKFLLPTDQLAIADFSSLSADDFASKTLWFAELAGNDTRYSNIVAFYAEARWKSEQPPLVVELDAQAVVAPHCIPSNCCRTKDAIS
jgi:hypothetical protein